jgi:hypothetical protein
MVSFEQIEELITELEGGNISAQDAVYKIAQARAMLARLYISLGNTSAAIIANPAHLQNVRAERLTEHLFDRVNGKG